MRIWICENCVRAGTVCEMVSEKDFEPSACACGYPDFDWHPGAE